MPSKEEKSPQLVWVDIPVADLARAERFYQSVLGLKLERDGDEKAVFRHEGSQVSGCLVVDSRNEPSTKGPLVYLSVEGHLEAAVAAAVEAGGRVLEEPHSLAPYGWRAIVVDSEGNRVGLHAGNRAAS